MDPTSPAMLLLQRLRDEAHEFANAVHRETRDYAPFYEMVNVFPSLTEPERQRLLKRFGSAKRASVAVIPELEKLLGPERAQLAMADAEAYRKGTRPRIKPLVVPIRFQDQNGAADDLRPIGSSSGKSRRIR